MLRNKEGRQRLFDELLQVEASTIRFSPQDYFAYSKTLDNLSLLLHKRGRYTVSEQLAVRALKIRQENVGETHPATGASLNNLAVLYKDMGKFFEAEKLIQPAL